MKNIHLPHSNSSLFVFNKGGSTLLTSTLKIFCNYKGIQLNNEFHRDNVVVITRNPIDRFFSGFLHYLNFKSGVGGYQFFAWEGDRNKKILALEELDKFLEECESGRMEYEVGDLHYSRQCKILGDYQIQNPKFYQIEWIHPQIEEVGLWDKISTNFDYNETQPLVDNQKVIDGLPFLTDLGIELSGWDGHFFCGTYQLVLRNLNAHHHRGDSKRFALFIRAHHQRYFMRITKWLENDIIKLGYEKSLL